MCSIELSSVLSIPTFSPQKHGFLEYIEVFDYMENENPKLQSWWMESVTYILKARNLGCILGLGFIQELGYIQKICFMVYKVKGYTEKRWMIGMV